MITRFPPSRSLLGGNPTNQDDDEEKRRRRRERGRRQIGERMRELSSAARADNGRLVDATLRFSSPRDLPDLLALTVADHGEDSVKDLGDIFTEMSKRDRGMARELFDSLAPKIRKGSEFLAPSKLTHPANAPKLAAVRRRDFLDGLESIVDGDAPAVATKVDAGRNRKPDERQKPGPDGRKPPKPHKPEKPDPKEPDDAAKCQQLEVNVANQRLTVRDLGTKLENFQKEIDRLNAKMAKLEDEYKAAAIRELALNLILLGKLGKVGKELQRFLPRLPNFTETGMIEEKILEVSEEIKRQVRLLNDTRQFLQNQRRILFRLIAALETCRKSTPPQRPPKGESPFV